MSQEEIFNKIADMIADRFEVDRSTITMNLNFQNDLDADSIDFVEFVMDLEDAFGSEIPDEDAEKLQTVGEAVEYIQNHQS
ncbi:acyl carrier protein [Lactobacillus sp. PV037]|uniref:acyl carrier protein n=1 Tax=unclassified Lactobacillus TaxID=2620435 RepID=UPI00223F3ACC|nr:MULTISPECIES: acyl carrier protein [unclassified Lactobacillus]QNQ82099.1 acyl carrier protein [Lactobacillus sp. PV012]QNQ83866.1 acyl carrier protein [Lactobacillus sp. PV037]